MKPSTDYTVITYDFGDVPLGRYDIYYFTNGKYNPIASATVQQYEDDYTVNASGTINYGHFVIGMSQGAGGSFNNNAVWNATISNANSVTPSGGASDRWIELKGSVGNSSYNGDYELSARFVAVNSTPFTVHYSVQANGSTSANVSSATGNVSSSVSYTIGLWDATTGQVVNQFKANSVTASCSNYQDSRACSNSKDIKDNVNGFFYFPNPSQGHTYFVYFRVHIDGGSDGSGTRASNGKMKLEGISGNIYITF